MQQGHNSHSKSQHYDQYNIGAAAGGKNKYDNKVP